MLLLFLALLVLVNLKKIKVNRNKTTVVELAIHLREAAFTFKGLLKNMFGVWPSAKSVSTL